VFKMQQAMIVLVIHQVKKLDVHHYHMNQQLWNNNVLMIGDFNPQ